MGISDRFGRRAGSGPRVGRVGRVGGVVGVNKAGIDRGTLISVGIAVAAAGALAAVALAAGGSALAAGQPGIGAGLVGPAAAEPTVTIAPPADGYQFVQLGSHQDKAFNQLLGINNHGRIAGYFGSNTQHRPNRGYTIVAPYAQSDFKSENFPHSLQTQVTGLNDNNVQVGFYTTPSGHTVVAGWYFNGSFHENLFPLGKNAKPTKDELFGVNDHDVAVGFYVNSAGHDRGYAFNIKTGKFSPVTKPGGGAPNLEATSINDAGDVAGAFQTSGGDIEGFLKLAGGAFHVIAVSGALETIALGVNDNDTVVGAYQDSSGGAVHGFIWRIGGSLSADVDDPNAVGQSVINGINNEGDIVGYYTDSDGNTDGFLAYPAF